jgi:hypothetical protein
MLRHLYRCIVRLHPSSFRQRFADEMLYIFDQQKGGLAAPGIALDGIISLFRQWILRPQAIVARPFLPRPAADHVPAFVTLDGFRPRTSAIMNGAALTLILFCMIGFGIRYSWIHVLHLQIREIGVDWAQQIRPQERLTHWLQLDPYVGEYVSNSSRRKISIHIEGDHLALAFAGQPSLALSPSSPKRFILGGIASNYIDFTSDDQGRICCLSLAINGKIIAAQRQ